MGRMARLSIGSFAAFAPAIAHGQSAQDFYKNRQLQLVVRHEVGNDYDVGARLLAKALSRRPRSQPTIVVQNMPQAAALVSANFSYTNAPRDGSAIVSI